MVFETKPDKRTSRFNQQFSSAAHAGKLTAKALPPEAAVLPPAYGVEFPAPKGVLEPPPNGVAPP